MLRHIVKNPLMHILINGVPGLGKTHLAVMAAWLYGQVMVQATSYGKNCVEGMIEKGIWNTKTLHARCLSALISAVLKTKKFVMLDLTEQVEREDERNKKASAVLNSMFPPAGMSDGCALLPVANSKSAGHSSTPQLEDVASVQTKVYSKFITLMMDAAHTERFGLGEMVGPKNPKTCVIGHMNAGPDVYDMEAWGKLAHSRFVDVELAEFLTTVDSETVDEVYAMLQVKLGCDDFDLHKALLEDFLELCPKVYDNMYQFFNAGTITLPDGTVTSRVWMYDDRSGAVVYNHRSLITYQEMMWLSRKLNVKLMSVYIALFYVDEWNDLTPLHLDVLMKIHQDASLIARLCNKPAMQMVFGGDVGQMIYAFQGTLLDPLKTIKTAFAIDDENCLIGSKSHRSPDAVIDFTNELCFRHPDAFLDPHGNVIQMQAVTAGRAGEVRRCVNVDTVVLPETVDLSQAERLPEDLKTVVALARNQDKVVEYWQSKVSAGEDWMLRLTGSSKTTRSILLEQLKFFEKNHITTLVGMKSWCKAKAHNLSHAYQRKCFEHLLEMADTATVDNAIAYLDALIKATYAHRPSKLATTMHGAKGEEYDVVIILKPESVPSAKALMCEHSHTAIYHADLHLLYVAYTRTRDLLIIAETELEKEEREKNEENDGNMQSSQETIADSVDVREPDAGDRTSAATPQSPLNVRSALDILELTESPKTMRELSTYVKTKRRHSQALQNDVTRMAEFDNASKVMRRHLLFEHSPQHSPAVHSLASNVSGGMLDTAAVQSLFLMDNSPAVQLASNLSAGMPSAETYLMEENAATTQAEIMAVTSELDENGFPTFHEASENATELSTIADAYTLTNGVPYHHNTFEGNAPHEATNVAATAQGGDDASTRSPSTEELAGNVQVEATDNDMIAATGLMNESD